MENIIQKYYLEPNSVLVKLNPAINGQVDCWFDAVKNNKTIRQHRSIAVEDIDSNDDSILEAVIITNWANL